jgi:hypothetical protein
VIERLGESDRLFRLLPDRIEVVRKRGHQAQDPMRANPGVMAAIGRAQMPVPRHVVALDADAAEIAGNRDVAAEKPGRPAAMVGFEQQIAVTRALGQRHELVSQITRNRRLTAKIGVEPQSPFGLIGGTAACSASPSSAGRCSTGRLPPTRSRMSGIISPRSGGCAAAAWPGSTVTTATKPGEPWQSPARSPSDNGLSPSSAALRRRLLNCWMIKRRRV